MVIVAILISFGASKAQIAPSNIGSLPLETMPEFDMEEMWKKGVSRGAAAPMVWVDSLLLIASLDRNVHLLTLDPEPATVWKQNFKGGFEAAPRVAERRIYFPETLKGGRLVAINRKSRQEVWTAKAGDLISSPIVTEDRIFTVSSVGVVQAYDLSGDIVWVDSLSTRVDADPVLIDNRIIIASSDGELFAIDRLDGQITARQDARAGAIWGDPIVRYDSDPTVVFATVEGQLVEARSDLTIVQRRSFPARFYVGPVVDDDTLYLIGHEGELWAYDWPTAEILWNQDLKGTFRGQPALSEDFVIAGNLAGTLYLLDRETGLLLWERRLDGALTSPAVTRGDEVFAITEAGTLYAFRRAASPASE